MVVILLIMFMPSYCYIQLLAANTSPLSFIGKQQIFMGVLTYVLLHDYRVISALIVSFPVRLRLINERNKFRELIVFDIKYSILPLLLVSAVILIVYWYIIYSMKPAPRFDIYLYYSTCSSIILILISIYVVVYAIPSSIIRTGFKKKILFGLSTSVPSSILALVIALFSGLIPIVLWSCRAQDLGIQIINPNTHMIEISLSIDLMGVLSNITWYTLYSYLIYRTGSELLGK